jgi:hypothetical protein
MYGPSSGKRSNDMAESNKMLCQGILKLPKLFARRIFRTSLYNIAVVVYVVTSLNYTVEQLQVRSASNWTRIHPLYIQ